MPPDYSMPYPFTSDCSVETDIHKHCTNLAKIVYYSEYKPYISFFILSAYLDNLILNKYSMIWDQLYKWVQEYRSRFYFLTQCEFIKVGSSPSYLTRAELIDKYIHVTGNEPTWYQRMFPNRYMAPICQQNEIRDRYKAFIEHATSRPRRLTTVQLSFV